MTDELRLGIGFWALGPYVYLILRVTFVLLLFTNIVC